MYTARRSFNGYRSATNPKSTGKDAIILHQDRNVNEVNSAKGTEEPVRELLHREPEVPLFLRDGPEGKKGDAQDEKDKTGE
jgi:hypothetical protein